MNSMNWKQFLKPDWIKVALFFGIIFLEFLLMSSTAYVVTADPYHMCCRNDLPEETANTCIRNNMTEEYCTILREKRAVQGFYEFITIIFILILDYLIACFIVWIFYYIFRKRNLKQAGKRIKSYNIE